MRQVPNATPYDDAHGACSLGVMDGNNNCELCMHELYRYIKNEQPRINTLLFQETEKLHPLVRPVAQHVLQGGGKRLRPLLVLLLARALGREPVNSYTLACSLEFLHSATLLHDDILDGAELRRGQVAAHLIFGVTRTILAGDALLALGNKLMASSGKPRLTVCISDAIINTAAGEIAEIAHIRDASLTEERYLEIITGKTAYLIQAACSVGAIAAGAGDDLIQAAADFGLNLGIAFQLVDDALDYAGSEDQVGKPVGRDLLEGKLTLPLLFYLQDVDDARRAWFLERLGMGAFTEEDMSDLVRAIQEAGCDTRAKNAAARYLETASNALETFPESREKALLRQVLDYVLARDK